MPQTRATYCRQAIDADEGGKTNLAVLEVDFGRQNASLGIPLALFRRDSPFTQSRDLNSVIAIDHRDIYAAETLGCIEGSAVQLGNERPAGNNFAGELVARKAEELIGHACPHGSVAMPWHCPLLHQESLV
jgi:hypothetical protein